MNAKEIKARFDSTYAIFLAYEEQRTPHNCTNPSTARARTTEQFSIAELESMHSEAAHSESMHSEAVETDSPLLSSKVSEVAKGDFVKFAPTSSAPVWIKGHFDHSSKTYSFTRADDMNQERFCKGSKECFIGFTY